MSASNKSFFIVSTRTPALHKESSHFIADPFFRHLIEANTRLAGAQMQVAPFIRSKPKHLRAANLFVWDKYKSYLPILAAKLNHVHHAKLPADFWRRALSMGLMRHLTMLYDFFTICETHFDPQCHSAYVLSEACFHIPVDYNEQRTFLEHSHFGQEQLLALYLRLFSPDTGISYESTYSSPYKFSGFACSSNHNPTVGLIGALFDSDATRDLFLKSNGAVAPIGFDFARPASPSVSLEMRGDLQHASAGFDRFDRFFFGTLPFLLPQDFVENFHLIYNAALSQFERYDRLRYVVCETFIGTTYESIALAILNMKGVQIIYNEHNYNEYPYFSSILEQQTSFADIFAAHGTYHSSIPHQVSTGSLFPFYEQSAIKDGKLFDLLYVCGVAQAKYSNYSHAFAQSAEHAETYYDFKLRFFESLSPAILKKFLYRPYPPEPGWELCYDDNALMGPFLPFMQRDDLSANARKRMRQSGMVVVDYIATTHMESMSMNVPTIIFYRRDSHHFNEESKDFLEGLFQVGICQDDPIKAAKFIEEIIADPQVWWSRPEVQAAKDAFLETNLGKPEMLSEFILGLANGAGRLPEKASVKHLFHDFVPTPGGVYVHPERSDRFGYSDGAQTEDQVLLILNRTSDHSMHSGELRSQISDWATEYHFSQERHNLLRHLRLNSSMSILELGCGCGAITRQLGESGARVTAVEGSLQRARCAASRCSDLPNVRVHCSNFQDLGFTQQYDLVTLIGVLEYSPQYFSSADPIGASLAIACQALKPEGVLVIAIENQLGLKYFSGHREDHTDIPYFGIEDRYQGQTAVTFGRQELREILQQMGLAAVEFQYPFPDYKIPQALFTEKAFQEEGFYPGEIIRQLDSRDYAGELTPAFREKLAVPVLCRNGMMQDLSNSFLVLASKERIPPALRDPEMLGAVYTTERANHYNVQTFFVGGENAIVARKSRLAHGASPISAADVLTHLPKDEEYIAGQNLEAEYRRCAALKDFAVMSRLLTLQLEFLSREATASPLPSNPAAALIRPEYFDCVPSNLILRNRQLHYIDREWQLNKSVSLGALLLRTVDVLHDLGKTLPELSKENLISLFNQYGFRINADTVKEYNMLIEDVVAQVYHGATASLPEATATREGTRNRMPHI